MMRRVRQELLASFGSMDHPGMATGLAWGGAVLAHRGVQLAARVDNAGVVGAALIVSLPAGFLAYWLGSAAVTLVADAKRSCLPGSGHLVRRTVLLTVALLLPVIAPTIAAITELRIRRAQIAMLLPLAILVAAVGLLLRDRWTRAMRPQSPTPRPAQRLRAIGIRIAASAWGDGAAARAEGRNADPPHCPPAQFVRTCLGGMFAPRSRQQRIIGAAITGLCILAAIAWPRLGPAAARSVMLILALLAAALISSAFLRQISKLTRGQLAELALIPGLGPARMQCHALSVAVLTAPLAWLGGVLIVGCTGLLLAGEPVSSIGVLAACLLVLWLGYCMLALQKLAQPPPKPQSATSEFVLLYTMVYASGCYSWVYSIFPQFGRWFWFWITPVLFGVAIAGSIGISVRRLSRAPHPFLS